MATRAAVMPLSKGPKTSPKTAPANFDGAPEAGVREHSDWANDIEQDIERDLARLANLSVDDHQRDPSKSADEHYRNRLNLLLNDKGQRFLYGNIGHTTMPSTAEPGTPVHNRPKSISAAYVNRSEFVEVKEKVDSLTQLVRQLADMHSQSQKEINALKSDVATLKTIAQEFQKDDEEKKPEGL
jgi:ribosomal protein L29